MAGHRLVPLETMEQFLTTAWRWWLIVWPHVLAVSILAINVLASAHAILVKRDTRSTIGWVGLIWLSPVFGAIAYAVLGVNRIRSRATQLRAGALTVIHELRASVPGPERLTAAIGPPGAPLRSLATLVGEVTNRPLVDGNTITALAGGDEAYPRMLAAIDGATRSIGLSSYIFDNDPTGRIFAEALARAVNRGVAPSAQSIAVTSDNKSNPASSRSDFNAATRSAVGTSTAGQSRLARSVTCGNLALRALRASTDADIVKIRNAFNLKQNSGLKKLAGGMLGLNLTLKLDERVEQSLRPRRAPTYINVDRNDPIHALQRRVTTVHAARTRAGAHGDHPFRRGHLIVNTTHHRRHFVGHGTGDDHAICLTRGKTHHLSAEARDVEAAVADGHQFDGAARQTHRHRPHGVSTDPVDDRVGARNDDFAFDLAVVAKFGVCGDHG